MSTTGAENKAGMAIGAWIVGGEDASMTATGLVRGGATVWDLGRAAGWGGEAVQEGKPSPR